MKWTVHSMHMQAWVSVAQQTDDLQVILKLFFFCPFDKCHFMELSNLRSCHLFALQSLQMSSISLKFVLPLCSPFHVIKSLVYSGPTDYLKNTPLVFFGAPHGLPSSCFLVLSGSSNFCSLSTSQFVSLLTFFVPQILLFDIQNLYMLFGLFRTPSLLFCYA